jgi:hypothetical protein
MLTGFIFDQLGHFASSLLVSAGQPSETWDNFALGLNVLIGRAIFAVPHHAV